MKDATPEELLAELNRRLTMHHYVEETLAAMQRKGVSITPEDVVVVAALLVAKAEQQLGITPAQLEPAWAHAMEVARELIREAPRAPLGGLVDFESH